MRRGTTPTLKIKINGVSLDQLKNIYVTLKQGNVEIEKSREEITVENNVISCTFKQQDTLQLQEGNVRIQIRASTKEGLALASNIISKYVADILKEGVIE